MQSFYMQNHDPSSLKPPPKLIKIPDLARFWFYLSRSSSFKIIQVQSTSKNFPSTIRRLNIYFFGQKRYNRDSFLPIFGQNSRKSGNFRRKSARFWKFKNVSFCLVPLEHVGISLKGLKSLFSKFGIKNADYSILKN